MAPAYIPTSVPLSVGAGTTWRWDRIDPSYIPADGWALTTYFRGAGNLTVVGVAASSGQSWENTALATETALLPAGVYRVTELVVFGAERYQIGAGTMRVTANPLLQAVGAGQAWEEVAVGKLEAYIAGSLDEGVLEFSIAGRAMKLLTPKEALVLLDDLRGRLAYRLNGRRRAPIVPVFRRGG